MIRQSAAADISQLLSLAHGTGVFKPHEISSLEEVLTDFVRKPGGEGYHAYTLECRDVVLGFEIHGPNPMTDRTWDLYWIAVEKGEQSRGAGTELLHFAELDMWRQGARLIMVETSSLPVYEPTRRFYLKHRYEQVGIVPDFYADGDSLVLFQKRLIS
jgi:GNAT superfamily N-acetyltransferase